MTTNTQTRTVIVASVFAGLFALAYSLSPTLASQPSAAQTVTITAQRMTTEQKLAFDREQQAEMQQLAAADQTVIISAKKMSAEQKAAFDAQLSGVATMVADNQRRSDAS